MTGEPIEIKREELWDLYEVAVEEYRFQVKLNIERSRDYVVLNSAIIAAGVTLLGPVGSPYLGAVVFAIGLVVAMLSIFGTHTQHGYYRDTRVTKVRLEELLGISGLVVRTTSAGRRYRRFGSVTNFNYGILALLGLFDFLGALSGLGVVPRPPAHNPAISPPAVTKRAPAQTAPHAAAPALPTKHSSSGPARPGSATPQHP